MRGMRPDLRVIDGGDGAADKPVRDDAAPSVTPEVPPAAPPTLPADLHEEWDQIVADLKARRLYQPTMLGTIEQYLVARWGVRRAQAMMEEHGELILGKDGTLKANPALGLLRTSQDTAARLAGELGLTPAGRSRKSLQSPASQGSLFDDGFDL